jgi:hypothetical protein
MKSIVMILFLLIGLVGLYGTNYSVQFDISELSTDINSRAFHEFQLVNCSSTKEIGYPKLPCRVSVTLSQPIWGKRPICVSHYYFIIRTYNVMRYKLQNLITGINNDLLHRIPSCTTAMLSILRRVHRSFHIRIWMVRTIL